MSNDKMQDMRPPEDDRRRSKDPEETGETDSGSDRDQDQVKDPKLNQTKKESRSQEKSESDSTENGSGRRSIRNVSLSHIKRNRRHHRTTQVNMEGQDIDEAPGPRSKRSWWPLWLVTAGALVILVFAVSTLFTNATITVIPAQITQDLELDVTASRSGSDLTFQTVSKDTSYEQTVSASETETVSEKASGRITVFNDHSEEAMRLIPTTRFQSEDGQVYRAPEAIRVPGRSADGTPGQITVTVVAQEPGESYNRTDGQFRLPGLKGDPSYDNVYAEVASPISGGLKGEQLIVSENEQQKVEQELRARARDRAVSELRSEIQEGQLFFPELVDISFGSLNQKKVDDTTTALSLNATVTAAVFSVDNLLAVLADRTGNQALSGELRSRDLSGLSFTTDQDFSTDQEEISGQFHGPVLVIQEVDEEKVKETVQGKAKDEGGRALTALESVKEVEIKMTPFWLRSFPQKAKDIKVELGSRFEEGEGKGAGKGNEEDGEGQEGEESAETVDDN